MTLVFPGFGKLLQVQLGANEIAAAITIGRFVGSLFTRSTDSKILGVIAAKFDIRLVRVPEWLGYISLSRSGRMNGAAQRKIEIENTIQDLEIATIEGVVTFVILILRYVEPTDVIVEYVIDLLCGKYKIIDGGLLKGNIDRLPFSVRGNLRTLVNGVIDADATSSQHQEYCELMTAFTRISSMENFSHVPNKYAQDYQEKMLRRLFDFEDVKSPKEWSYDTVSIASAMIAVAAMANGANIELECVTESGRFSLSQGTRSPKLTPFVVRIWLTQPPGSIAWPIGLGVLKNDGLDEADVLGNLPAHGGSAEISLVVARQVQYHGTPEEILALWTAGSQAGESSSLKMSSHFFQLALSFTDDFLSVPVDSKVAYLAATYQDVPRGDPRHGLANKAASIYHSIFNYADYESVNANHVHRALDLILVAMGVGCLKQLINADKNRLASYSWVADCSSTAGSSGIRYFCSNLATGHVLFRDLLWIVSTLWGGVIHGTHYEGDKARIIGIVCPQATFCFNVILDPCVICRSGMTEGLISLYEGSVALLPQDSMRNFIIAGKPKRSSPAYLRPRGITSNVDSGPVRDLVFTLEPDQQPDGLLTAVLCCWHEGANVLVLDPYLVMSNLLLHRNHFVEGPSSVMQGDLKEPPIILGQSLLSMGDQASPLYGPALIDVGPRLDLQILAAGMVTHDKALLITEQSEASRLIDPWLKLILSWRVVVILGCDYKKKGARNAGHVETTTGI